MKASPLHVAHLLDICHADALQDQLSYAVSLVDLEVLAAMVEQNHPNGSSVVVVYNSSANVDHLLHGQAGSRGNARVRVGRDGDGEVRLDESLASGGDRGLVGTGEQESQRRRIERRWASSQGVHHMLRISGATRE